MIPRENKQKIVLDIKWDMRLVFLEYIKKRVQWDNFIKYFKNIFSVNSNSSSRNFDVIAMYFLIKRPNQITRIKFIIKIG